MTAPGTSPSPSPPAARIVRDSLASGSGFSSLPSEVMTDSCRRVGTVAMAFAGLWVFAILMHTLVPALIGMGMREMPPGWETMYFTITIIGLVKSLAMAWIARRWSHRKALLLDLGLIYMVASSALLGIMNHWVPQPSPWGLSWIAFLIVAYAAIVPTPPRKLLVAGLVAASMDPIGLLLTAVRGVTVTYSAYEMTWLFVPNYLAALIAVIPAKIVAGLGRQVRKARELGSYKLGDLIGRGGMGEVYRAEHRMLARPAAIKLIRQDLLSADLRDAVMERFRREALAAAALQSPHSISLYDFGVSREGAFYYVMELLDGVDADALVRRFGPQPPERVAHLVAQAADSLAEAHAHGLIHRDVKPSNVFVAKIGLQPDFVKILDFGLVRATIPGRDEARLTAPNVVPGTATYMAPEIAAGRNDSTGAGDVYALACVAYWLLTGHLVFDGDSPIQIIVQHAREAPVPPSERCDWSESTKLDPVIMRALAKDPGDRPTALELARALRGLEFRKSWAGDRADHWWSAHMDGHVHAGPCDKGELVPEEALTE